MAVLAGTSEWTQAVYPNALPYMVKHRCFDYCVPTPDCKLRYMPPPCLGTYPCPPPGADGGENGGEVVEPEARRH